MTQRPSLSLTKGRPWPPTPRTSPHWIQPRRQLRPPAKPKSKRILELDALRAIAALNLLMFHFTWVYVAKYGFESPVGFVMPYGKYGVQLFFMLSGFVNAFTLIRKMPTPKDFSVGRAIRIVPSFWLVVIMNVGLLSMFPMLQQNVSAEATLANMTVMPHLFGFECMEPVTWTLMIELLFYGFLLFLLFTGRLAKPLFSVVMLVLGVCMIGGLGNQFIQQEYAGTGLGSVSAFVDQVMIFRWMPLFAMGILLNEIKMKRGTIWLNCIGILLAGAAFHIIDVKDHNPKATALLFVLLALCAYGRLPVLRFKPLLFIGTISYSLYLFHNNIGTVFMSWLESMGVYPMVAFVMTFAFVVAMSAAITYKFEQPVTKFLQRRWKEYKSTRQESVPAGSLAPGLGLKAR